jgi:hypothetical protein
MRPGVVADRVDAIAPDPHHADPDGRTVRGGCAVRRRLNLLGGTEPRVRNSHAEAAVLANPASFFGIVEGDCAISEQLVHPIEGAVPPREYIPAAGSQQIGDYRERDPVIRTVPSPIRAQIETGQSQACSARTAVAHAAPTRGPVRRVRAAWRAGLVARNAATMASGLPNLATVCRAASSSACPTTQWARKSRGGRRRARRRSARATWLPARPGSAGSGWIRPRPTVQCRAHESRELPPIRPLVA